ncbi:hypothetical protein EC968_006987 [Mortierella alpina]|nr:hypothetical protein EC968_006987 [Mortierella alpina]
MALAASDSSPDTRTVYQSFHDPHDARPVKIPAVRHPVTGEYYVIWSDILDCFPGVLRVQHGSYYVPYMRDDSLYRVRPHGIKYHPNVVLDIVYAERQPTQRAGRPSTRTKDPIHARATTRSQQPATTKPANGSTIPLNWALERELARAFTGSSAPSSPPVSEFSSLEDDAEEVDEHEELVYNDEDVVVDADAVADTDENAHPDEDVAGERESDLDIHHQQGIMDAVDENTDRKEKVEKMVETDNTNGSTLNVNDTVRDGNAVETASTPSASEPAPPIATEPEDDSLEELHVATTALTSAATHHEEPQTEQEKAFANLQNVLARVKAEFIDRLPPQSAVALKDEPSSGPVTFMDVLERRGKEILQKRYHWADAVYPKLFYILPFVDTAPESENEKSDLGKPLTFADFRVHFFCDCGDIKEFNSNFVSHCKWKDMPKGYSIKVEKEDQVIEEYGDYLMAVLEILMYGAYVDGMLQLLAQTDPMLQRGFQLSVKFLESKGITSAKRLMMETSPQSVEEVAPIPALDTKQLRRFVGSYLHIAQGTRCIGGMHPYLTPDRDVRWVSLTHWVAMSGHEELAEAMDFSNHPASSVCEFDTETGAFRAEIKTRERARDFYRLAEKLKTVCVLRLFLDWTLTLEDEDELAEAVSRFPAPVVKVMVRTDPSPSEGAPGFGIGYSDVILAALANRKIEAFAMNQRNEDQRAIYGHDERFTMENPSLSDSLARFQWDPNTERLTLELGVTDLDKSIVVVRYALRGLHRLSRLKLRIDHWENVEITFIEPGQPGSEIEDKNYDSGNLAPFFESRKCQDKIKYSCQRRRNGSLFFPTKSLTEVTLTYAYARDRNRIRDILKQNKSLRTLELWNDPPVDDASQIFETYKSLMANHPTLTKFQVQMKHMRGGVSDFSWTGVSGPPADMSVRLSVTGQDKVVSVFQKYATSLSSLNLESPSVQDVSVLEKALRPKKGPFKLRRLMVTGTVEMQAGALEDLKRIILRTDFEEVLFGGSMEWKPDDVKKGLRRPIELLPAIARAAEFLVSINTKVTYISFYGKEAHTFLEDLADSKGPGSCMPRLQELTISGETRQRLVQYRWFLSLILYKSRQGRDAAGSKSPPEVVLPLQSLSLSNVEISEFDWNLLLGAIDFNELETLRLEQTNPMTGAVLQRIVDAFSDRRNNLTTFVLRAPGLSVYESAMYQQAMLNKAKGARETPLVMINDFM